MRFIKFSQYFFKQSGAIIGCFTLCALVNSQTKFFVFPIPFEIEAGTVSKILFLDLKYFFCNCFCYKVVESPSII
jgi:hypothetical protein